MSCPTLASESRFLTATLTQIDCQAQAVGTDGYLALAAPGSVAVVLLTAVLTIFIALFGYRMLLGRVPDVRESVLAIVKIGVVMMLATSWPAFRVLVYDVSMQAPAELSASIGGAAELPGAGGDLVTRLQRIDDLLVELARLGTGRPNDGDRPALATPKSQGAEAAQAVLPPRLTDRPAWDAQHDAAIVELGRILFLTVAIAAFASVRILTGLLLALGPIFALFLLFDATRGLFEGWVRGLVGAALGALGTGIVLGVELALVEPWMTRVLAARHSDVATPGVPAELVAVGLAFGIALSAVLFAVARVAGGFRFPEVRRLISEQGPAPYGEAARGPAPPAGQPVEQPSRAQVVAEAVAASQSREAASIVLPELLSAHSAAITGGISAREKSPETTQRLGHSNSRRTVNRTSARAKRRDASL